MNIQFGGSTCESFLEDRLERISYTRVQDGVPLNKLARLLLLLLQYFVLALVCVKIM